MIKEVASSSKDCFKCGVNQPLSEFYKHKQMADGHLNKCKSCAKKDIKDNILKNHEYYKEYDRGRANLPHRVEARRQYSKTEECKESYRKSSIAWKKENAVKRAAHVLVGNSVRDGKIFKPSNCSECNKSGCRIHGHHDDYSKPLSVRWLCQSCHIAWHKINGEVLVISDAA